MPRSLPAPERELTAAVAAAAVANPFSLERDELDYSIIGARPPAAEQLPRLMERVDRLVEGWERDRRADIRLYSGDDRRMVEKVLLFAIFHRFLREFDDHIMAQEKRGDEPLAIDFAGEALKRLHAAGFSGAAALEYFAIFFQLRRAHDFIHRRLVGASPVMRRLRIALWNNVFTHDLGVYEDFLRNRLEDFSTMLLGETGTGKGTAAAAIGYSGFIPFEAKAGRFVESFARAFVAMNLSQFPETLIESELFGHRKGAFTGAIEAHPGLFARCSPHGAVFLDEIGELNVPVQIKLLRVLEERVFTPLGGHEKKRFSGRVIVATNRPLFAAGSHFREDLYYRLCSDVILLPTLRERLSESADELPALVAVFVERLVGEPAAELQEKIMAAIRRDLAPDYAWPGNVRELEQCVRSILLTGKYAPPRREAAADEAGRLAAELRDGALTADQLLGRYAALLHRRLGTYEAVAAKLETDARTAKKYVKSGGEATR